MLAFQEWNVPGDGASPDREGHTSHTKSHLLVFKEAERRARRGDCAGSLTRLRGQVEVARSSSMVPNTKPSQPAFAPATLAVHWQCHRGGGGKVLERCDRGTFVADLEQIGLSSLLRSG